MKLRTTGCAWNALCDELLALSANNKHPSRATITVYHPAWSLWLDLTRGDNPMAKQHGSLCLLKSASLLLGAVLLSACGGAALGVLQAGGTTGWTIQMHLASGDDPRQALNARLHQIHGALELLFKQRAVVAFDGESAAISLEARTPESADNIRVLHVDVFFYVASTGSEPDGTKTLVLAPTYNSYAFQLRGGLAWQAADARLALTAFINEIQDAISKSDEAHIAAPT